MDATVEQAPASAPELSAADARREARRRKILETAKSRLEKLNGGQKVSDANNIDAAPSTNMEYSDPEVEPNIPAGLLAQEEAFNRPFYATTNSIPVNVYSPNIFVKSRAHIFIASIIGYILSHYATNCLFVPVGLCIITELVFLKGQPYPTNSLLSVVLPMTLLFTGASWGNKIKQINGLLYISHSLIVNLAINIFCICLSSYVLQFIGISHFVDIK